MGARSKAGPCLFPDARWCGTQSGYAFHGCRGDACFDGNQQRRKAGAKGRVAGVPNALRPPIVLPPPQRGVPHPKGATADVLTIALTPREMDQLRIAASARRRVPEGLVRELIVAFLRERAKAS